MKFLSLHIFVKIIVLLILIINQYLQNKINSPNSKENYNYIDYIMEKLNKTRDKLGLTCKNYPKCLKAASDIIHNLNSYSFSYKSYLINLAKCTKYKNGYEFDKNETKDFNIIKYYKYITNTDVKQLDCFLNSYYKLHNIIDWILIAKDFKDECLTMFKNTLNFLDDNKKLIHNKNIELEKFFNLFEYIISYISVNLNIFKEKYLFGLYIIKNKNNINNKLLNINNTNKDKKTYLYSPNLLKFSNDFSTIIKYVKEQAKKFKVILFVLVNYNETFQGHHFDNLYAADYYYTPPLTTFEVSKIDINNEEDTKKFFKNYSLNYNYDYNNNDNGNGDGKKEKEKLSKNINIIKLQKTFKNIVTLVNLKNNAIFSIIDTTDNKFN